MFEFSYDPDGNLLKIVQSGYWTVPIFRDYEAEFRRHHAAIRQSKPHYRVLADCRDYPVQSLEMGVLFEAMFETIASENKGPYAVIVGSVLNKLQVKRALAQEHIQTFSSLETAMAWLFAEGRLPG